MSTSPSNEQSYPSHDAERTERRWPGTVLTPANPRRVTSEFGPEPSSLARLDAVNTIRNATRQQITHATLLSRLFKYLIRAFAQVARPNVQVMSAEDYAEHFAGSRWLDQYIDESFWMDNFKADVAHVAMVQQAERDGIVLTGLDEFDYETFFYGCYQCAEKGLS